MRASEFDKLRQKDLKELSVLQDLRLSLECLDCFIDDYVNSENKFCPICLNNCTDNEDAHDSKCLFGKIINNLHKKEK